MSSTTLNITIEDLFNMIIKKFANERKKNPRYDGKKGWQPFKNIFDRYDIDFEWQKLSKSKVIEIMSLIEFNINGFGEQTIIEINHFCIQTVRIPTTEAPSLKKLIQIALNLGQYYGLYKRNNIVLPYVEFKHFVKDAKRLAKINCEDFISKPDLKLLIKLINT